MIFLVGYIVKEGSNHKYFTMYAQLFAQLLLKRNSPNSKQDCTNNLSKIEK